MTPEHTRLEEDRARHARWRQWGPYLSERAWGTVREDYSANADAWRFFPHDHARSRAYRWNEDGIAGICDRGQIWCLALSLWNEKDPILKERLFGLSGHEGNHGEDVKELHYYEDATPTSSYLKYLYKYPQCAFPYDDLIEKNRARGTLEGEVDLPDLGVFDEGRYFDVTVEYAKASPADILMVVTAENRGPDEAPLHILPTLWFRNTWAWGSSEKAPEIAICERKPGYLVLCAAHATEGSMYLHVEGDVDILFTDNETNAEALFGTPSQSRFTKDGFHRFVVQGEVEAVNPEHVGSKSAAWYQLRVPAKGKGAVRCRLSSERLADPFGDANTLLATRKAEADDYYAAVQGPHLPLERRSIYRQAAAGLLWTLQFYNYDVRRWLAGDQVPPPASRLTGRNADWQHFHVADVISMPDKWEYPWFAAWDLAFHAVAMSSFDIELAKSQIKLMVKEWYQHPSGQIPAYEWEFGDLNPPVHAWATYQIYKIERKQRGQGDRVFLERVFHKLLINFAWWVNRRDAEGNNIFEGGFLGLDNISIFDRSEKMPEGVRLEQADATAWMAMYCLDLMRIALELAIENSAYEDLASKFFEHFLHIAHALNFSRKGGMTPWSEEHGFYFDILVQDGRSTHIPVKSLVGLVPLFAVHVIPAWMLDRLSNFRRRTEWFLQRNPQYEALLSRDADGRILLSAVPRGRLERVLEHLFAEDQFMSEFGPRSLSKEHEAKPISLWFQKTGQHLEVGYEPGESVTRMKGGNSNWRGPIWFPTAYLLYRSLLRLDHGLGQSLRIPRAGKPSITVSEAAEELAERLIRIFERGPDGHRPVYGDSALFQSDPHFREKILFFEYFNGDTGAGLGASHQTGWTGLVADLISRKGRQGMPSHIPGKR